jgi:hypothetical protein
MKRLIYQPESNTEYLLSPFQIKRNLQTAGIASDKETIRETWHPVFRRNFLRRALSRCYDCRRGFYMYNQALETEVRKEMEI